MPFVSEPLVSISGLGRVTGSGASMCVGLGVGTGLGRADVVDARRKMRPTACAIPGRLDNRRVPLGARAPTTFRLAAPFAPVLYSAQSVIVRG